MTMVLRAPVFPAVLGADESHALTNGTGLLTGADCLVADPAATLVQASDMVAGLTLEAFWGDTGRP